MTAATGPLLWGRAAVLSGGALSTGAFAHVQADGLLPGVGVLVALVVVGALASAPFLRRRGSTLRIVSLLIGGQTAVHTVLAATGGHRGDPVPGALTPAVAPTVTSPGRSGSYYDVAYATPTGGHGDAISLPAPLLHAITDAASHPMMALAHLVAAAVCGWWLALGERAVWRLVELTARGWSGLVVPALLRWAAAARAVAYVASEVQVPTPGAVRREPRPVSVVHSRSVSRRGPPLAA